ncbi:MAG: hypothetical protein AAF492_04970, partial [Verrucomicrobiota bacterium]
FVTGDDTPFIGGVVPAGTNNGQSSVTLWAENISDVDDISNVWCLVSSPGLRETSDVQRIDLELIEGTPRYEAVFTNLTEEGTYTFTFYAVDDTGRISDPVQTRMVGPDSYEPDNTSLLARACGIGLPQSHDFHVQGDRDWVRFFVGPGQLYTIEAEQIGEGVDLVLDLYREQFDGSLMLLESDVDLESEGALKRETITLDLTSETNRAPGLHVLCIRPEDDSMWGADTDYELTVFVPNGAPGLTVFAFDRLSETAPSGAYAVLDGGQIQMFGNALSVTYPDVTPGTHTITVETAYGYRSDEDPLMSGQVENPASSLFGRPRQLEKRDDTWQSATFRFFAEGTVRGVVRDAFTGAWLADVPLRFDATTGWIATNSAFRHFDAFPNFAVHETPWITRMDGQFPSNLTLPVVDWTLQLEATNYLSLYWTNAVQGWTAGETARLGTIYLTPVDTNGNGIADDWETAFFGAPVSPLGDADNDGMNNLSEYRFGTDPTDAASDFHLLVIPSNGPVLSWPSAPGREYRVLTSTNLSAGDWTFFGTTMTGRPDQLQLKLPLPEYVPSNLFFRLQVDTP